MVGTGTRFAWHKLFAIFCPHTEKDKPAKTSFEDEEREKHNRYPTVDERGQRSAEYRE